MMALQALWDLHLPDSDYRSLMNPRRAFVHLRAVSDALAAVDAVLATAILRPDCLAWEGEGGPTDSCRHQRSGFWTLHLGFIKLCVLNSKASLKTSWFRGRGFAVKPCQAAVDAQTASRAPGLPGLGT